MKTLTLTLILLANLNISRAKIQLLGFQSIFINDSKKQVINKIKNYKILIFKKDFRKKTLKLNPYSLISQFNYPYSKNNLLPIQIQNQVYFINLKDYQLKDPKYYTQTIKNNYIVNYQNLEQINIKKSDLKHLNPLLSEIEFHFFKQKLYQINYKLKINLIKTKRLTYNLLERHGKAKEIKIKKSSKNKKDQAIFQFINQGKEKIEIKLKMPKERYYNLTKIPELSEKTRKLTKQEIEVSLSNIKSKNKIKIHKKNIIKNILEKLESIINQSEQRLIELKKKSSKKNNQNPKKYKFIDSL